MEELLKSPEMLLIVSGIVALVAAITKGGFSVGPATIPSLSAMQCKYICGLGVVLFVTGVGLVVASPKESIEVEPVPVVPVVQTVDKEPEPETPQTVDIKGKLIDFFENPIEKAKVNCDFEGNLSKSDVYTTRAKGYFSFKNIPDRKTVFLSYGNHKDTLTADSDIQDIIQFRINPIDIKKSEFKLCKSVDSLIPYGTFKGHQPVISLIDLPSYNDEYRVISCFIRLKGNEGGVQREIMYEWVDPDGVVDSTCKKNINWHIDGWRTYATRKVKKKGNWTFRLKTLKGDVIKEMFFMIV